MMKKLLLTTAACGLALSASAAHAEVDLDIGGYFKGYGAYVDQDETAAGEVNEFDMIRNTEIHFTGESTLDNGLTVGFHLESTADGGDSFTVDESYAYFSGGWGRFNIGAEDGAGYLLQVAAPSADENIDGIRQFVSPINYTALGVAGLVANPTVSATGANAAGLDYDMDPTQKSDKITYLTPIMGGFQAGASFTPDSDGYASEAGIGLDDVEDTAGRAYEGSVRYEGQFNNVGMILGAGYAFIENEQDASPVVDTDDRHAWNVGADFDIGPFGIGAAYTQDDVSLTGAAGGEEEETIVVGLDYTTGPFKVGASYLDQDNTFGITDLESKRYAGGVTYTYGPGMTFRGSVGYVEHEPAAAADVDATYVTLGTQINF